MPPRFRFSTTPSATVLTAVLAALLAIAGLSARPADPAYRVCLQPLGDDDASLLGPIGRGVAQAYGFEVRRLAARPLPKSAWYPPRSRYRAQRLLEHLRDEVMAANPRCDAVLGFTAADVSITKAEHLDWGVMGLAYAGGRVAVVSSFRLRRNADRQRLVERSVKVVIHELGHVIGLPHRADGPTCIMNDARGAVQTIDRAQGMLCARERAIAEALLGRSLPHRDALDWQVILTD